MSSPVVEKKRRGEQATDRLEKIDFKMVTFSLSGKDYGIDIMKIKEISKAGKFTYVPNSAPYVRGVYNLRGDIISIIDLRIMFHLPAEKKQEDALENVLILRLEDHIMGIVVDSIDKVVGISRENIQPPHPIFGDINIKYISGVVENASRLYIILDVDRIFSREKEEKKERMVFSSEEGAPAEERVVADADSSGQGADLDLSFIAETLFTFRGFAVTPLNMNWMKTRYEEWKKLRASEKRDLQLKESDEAELYLDTFASPCSGVLWTQEYADQVAAVLPETADKSVTVWNPGCAGGFETYSMACILRRKYQEARIRVYANDSDLLNISTAPNMLFRKSEVPEWLMAWMTEGRNGFGFRTEMKDLIMFEYHDILNTNPIEQVDVIITRDVLSFQRPEDQQRLLDEFQEKLKEGGVLILGKNERLVDFSGWKALESGEITAYVKIKQ